MTAASDNGAPTPPSPEYHTLDARDVLTIRPEGPLDFERSRDALEALVRHRGFGKAERNTVFISLFIDLRLSFYKVLCLLPPTLGGRYRGLAYNSSLTRQSSEPYPINQITV
jgi:hypothetical protein